jgi:hypothetical protein
MVTARRVSRLAGFALLAGLAGCSTPGALEQAHLKQIRHYRELCMSQLSAGGRPMPLLRASAIHQCNAWSRSKVL